MIIRFKNILSKIKQIVCVNIFKLFPIKTNKIVMNAYDFSKYGCNPKHFTEYLLKKFKDKYEIVWVFYKYRNVPDIEYLKSNNVKCIYLFSIKYYYHKLTGKFFIYNNRCDFLVNKRIGQIYIQTWHALAGFKRAELDAIDDLSSNYLRLLKKDGIEMDYIISGVNSLDKYYEKYFYGKDKILRIGTPRNDIFYKNDQKNKSKIRRAINIDNEYKLVLYVPTFRGTESTFYDLDYEKICNILEKKYKGKWKVLVKLHPNIAHLNKVENTKYAKDVSNYGDAQDLIYISEIIITDYSSTIFDGMVAKKIGFLYQIDYEFYKNSRGFVVDSYRTPFPVARNLDTLYKNIEDLDEDKYYKAIQKYKKDEGFYENGTACKKLEKLLSSYIEK